MFGEEIKVIQYHKIDLVQSNNRFKYQSRGLKKRGKPTGKITEILCDKTNRLLLITSNRDTD